MMKLHFIILVGVAVLFEATNASQGARRNSPNTIPNDEENAEAKGYMKYNVVPEDLAPTADCSGTIADITARCEMDENYIDCMAACRKVIGRLVLEQLSEGNRRRRSRLHLN